MHEVAIIELLTALTPNDNRVANGSGTDLEQSILVVLVEPPSEAYYDFRLR